MYEDYTYEAILERMLLTVPDDIDKRPGSLIYDSLSAAAAKMAELYIDMESNLELGFIETSNGMWIDRRIAERGLSREQAGKAIRLATFNVSVEAGERFLFDTLYFVVISAGTASPTGILARVECETAGEVGNVPGGNMSPVNTIPGLTSAVLGEVLVPGEDVEEDQDVQGRYLNHVRKPATSGNKYHYEQWALSVQGVGGVKVIPLWDGPGTVKVVLIDNDKRAVTPVVAQNVKDYIDPNDGDGEGQAPIGATLTSVPAEEVPINISGTLTMASWATIEEVTELFKQGLSSYLEGLAFKDPLLRYTRITALLLDIPPIIDYEDVVVNGEVKNIELLPTQVAVPGTVTFSAK